MKFAKVCKVLRFVVLPFALIFAIVFAISLAVYFEKAPEITIPGEKEEALAAIIYNGIYAAIFIIADIAFFVIYAIHKRKIEWENLKREARDRRVDIGKRRKTKILLRVLAIIIAANGLIFSAVFPPAGWLVIIGGGMFGISFAIRTRTHEGNTVTNRKYDGSRLTVTYPDDSDTTFKPLQLADIIQDITNDGYLVFEDFNQIGNGRVSLIFSTKFSKAKLQEQHDRRDKYYLSGGKNASDMPPYFSEKTLYTYKMKYYDGEQFETKEAVYTWDEVEIYKGDKLIRTEQRNKRLSHYVINTYQNRFNYYSFFYWDGTPFKTVGGDQLEVEVIEKRHIESRRA